MTDYLLLNLGSGSVPTPGWINVDIADIPGVDVVHDLDKAPWPWADGTVSRITAYDIFEHVNEPITFMLECWRVLCRGGLLDLHVSYWQSQNAFTDPTHKRFCTHETFDYWVPGTHLHERYGDAYALSKTARFDKLACGLDGQELAVVLRKQ